MNTKNANMDHELFVFACFLFRLLLCLFVSQTFIQNDYLKIIQLPQCSLPAVREFANVLVKADIRGIRLSIGGVYTVTESFIRDKSRLQTERVDTIHYIERELTAS